MIQSSRYAMTHLPPHIILSAAKDRSLVVLSQCRPEILRCAQDDRREGLFHDKKLMAWKAWGSTWNCKIR
jgi:hypothetical protein